MYTAMKSIFQDKNRQEALFFEGPGKDLDVRTHTPSKSEGVHEIQIIYICVATVYVFEGMFFSVVRVMGLGLPRHRFQEHVCMFAQKPNVPFT